MLACVLTCYPTLCLQNQTKHSDGGATLHRSKGLPNKLDGYNMYDSLTTGTESPRTEVVYNFDSSTTWGSAIRVGEWKLITGQKAQEWFPVPGSASEAELMKKNGVVGTGGYSTSIGGGGGGNSSAVASGTGMGNGNGIAEAGVQCTGSGGQAKCDYLFHIASDPDETTNLFSSEPERVASLLAKLEAFRAAEAPCNTCGSTDPAAEAEAARLVFGCHGKETSQPLHAWHRHLQLRQRRQMAMHLTTITGPPPAPAPAPTTTTEAATLHQTSTPAKLAAAAAARPKMMTGTPKATWQRRLSLCYSS